MEVGEGDNDALLSSSSAAVLGVTFIASSITASLAFALSSWRDVATSQIESFGFCAVSSIISVSISSPISVSISSISTAASIVAAASLVTSSSVACDPVKLGNPLEPLSSPFFTFDASVKPLKVAGKLFVVPKGCFPSSSSKGEAGKELFPRSLLPWREGGFRWDVILALFLIASLVNKLLVCCAGGGALRSMGVGAGAGEAGLESGGDLG